MKANNKLLLYCDGATALNTVGLDDAALLGCIGNATGQEPRGQRYLAVVGRKLVQQLLDSVSLPWAVHVRHPVLRQAAEILVNLYEERHATSCKIVFSVYKLVQLEDLHLYNLFLRPAAVQQLHTLVITCSGLSPGGIHAYSSEAQPESSSEMEFLWKSDTSLVIIFSSCPGTECTACSSRTHLQCTQIFLRGGRSRYTFPAASLEATHSAPRV